MAETTTNGEVRIKTAWIPHIVRLLTVAGGLYVGYEILKTQVADLKSQMFEMQKFKETTMVQNAVIATEVGAIKTEVKEINNKMDRLLRQKNDR